MEELEQPTDWLSSDIKWIKSVDNETDNAYLDIGEYFDLHHKDEKGLKKIELGDLLLLYQKINKEIYFTHLVTPVEGENPRKEGTAKHSWVRKMKTVAKATKETAIRRRETEHGNFSFKKLSFPNVQPLENLVKGDNLKAFQDEIFEQIPWYEKRLFRLTWNINGWTNPVFHKWKKENQGNKNIAYENQYGYGHEEWLMNPLNQLNGYQYGHLQGANDINTYNINEVILFTIEPKTGNRYIVGYVKNIEVIDEGDFSKEIKILNKRFLKNKDEFINDLKSIGADYSKVEKADDFGFNVRFKLTGNEIYDVMILLETLRGRRWNRFKPYHIFGDLEKILEGAKVKKAFEFVSGIAKTKKNYTKNTKEKSTTVNKTHSNISEDIAKFLSPQFSNVNNNLSVDKTYFGSNLADVVLKHQENLFTIIEIKTSANARRNIREALGQLLDYALWDEEVKIKDLIIVAPTPLGKEELNLFKRLKKNIQLKLKYWQYCGDMKNVNGRFKEII